MHEGEGGLSDDDHIEGLQSFRELQALMLKAEHGDAPALNTMVDNIALDEFLELIACERTLCVDARSPCEFAKGQMPGAYNVPLLTDKERTLIGRTFKQQGRSTAVDLGFRLLKKRAGALADAVETKAAECGASVLAVYCWRGGLRSNSFALFIRKELDRRGRTPFAKLVVLTGGYKGFKKHARECYDQGDSPEIVIVGGKTGVGKTKLLHRLQDLGQQILDLEGIAQHSGSTFGRVGYTEEQPTTEQYTNLVGMAWRALDPHRPVFIEDEGPNVGNVTVPPVLFSRMRNPKLVVKLEVPEVQRVTNLLEQYVLPSPTAEEYEEWYRYMCKSATKLEKRLGRVKLKQTLAALESKNYAEVAKLLLAYYDKMYDYHFARGREHVTMVDLALKGPCDQHELRFLEHESAEADVYSCIALHLLDIIP